VGEAAVGKEGAGEAAAVQANCIWLISGTTVTLNFLKKSMPRMGPAAAACKKLDVKNLPLNCTVFFSKSPRGDWLPICPFEKGTGRWAGILAARNNAQSCSSINQIPVISQFICEKNQTCIGWKMHSRGIGVCCEIYTHYCQGFEKSKSQGVKGRQGSYFAESSRL
jgi:hypothetical protein